MKEKMKLESEIIKSTRFYDGIPRFVSEEPKELLEPLDVLNRNFCWEGECYELFIYAAQILNNRLVTRYFPGEREKKVEEALRSLATKRNEDFVEDERALYFTSHQIKESLCNQLSIEEVELALEILSHTSYLLSNGSISFTFFIISNLLSREFDGKLRYRAVLNPLMVGNNENLEDFLNFRIKC